MQTHEESHKVNKDRYELWEQKLSAHGLSEHQIGAAELQDIPHTTPFTVAHDPKLKPGHWATRASGGHDAHDIFELCQQVPVREQGRSSVPEWALHRDKIEALILHLYPTLARNPAKVRSTPEQLATVRRRAARTAAQIYLAFCCNWQDEDIANALDLKRHSVAHNLMLVRKAGDKYFSIRRNEVATGEVLVHHCHAIGCPQPNRCACARYVSSADAKEMVRQGLAEYLWLYPSDGNAFQTHGAVVVVSAGKTPRVQTLEKAHMERAFTSSRGHKFTHHEEVDRVEAYGEMTLQWVTDLIVEPQDDPDAGRAILISWGDQRTHT